MNKYFFFTIFVLITLFQSCSKLEYKCSLMYKLKPSAFATGIDSESCLLLSSLQNITALPVPVEISDIRAQLETGQIQPFSDSGFNQYLSRLYGLDLDQTALTPGEITILNVIREYLDPPPSFNCCGGVNYPSLTTDFDLIMNPRVGSITFEYEVRVELNNSFTCDLTDVAVSINVIAGPNPNTVAFTHNDLGCINGKRTFSFLWESFFADPIGVGQYDFQVGFRDSLGVIQTVVVKNVNL